jgi:hypothetical protein
MAVAKKKPAPKKKRAPAGLSGTQNDAIQSMRDRNLDSLPGKLKRGEIDPGDSADPTPGRGTFGDGVLDPEEFEKFTIANRPAMNETQRISKIICEHLNEFYSRNGKFQWTCGFFPPTDPRAAKGDGFQPLTTEMIGEAWSTQLQVELGLTVFNGALCWNGRGTFERHIICVKTKQLQERQLLAKEEASKQQLRHPEAVAGERMGRMEVTERTTKLPLVPVSQDGNPNDGGTLTPD